MYVLNEQIIEKLTHFKDFIFIYDVKICSLRVPDTGRCFLRDVFEMIQTKNDIIIIKDHQSHLQ